MLKIDLTEFFWHHGSSSCGRLTEISWNYSETTTELNDCTMRPPKVVSWIFKYKAFPILNMILTVRQSDPNLSLHSDYPMKRIPLILNEFLLPLLLFFLWPDVFVVLEVPGEFWALSTYCSSFELPQLNRFFILLFGVLFLYRTTSLFRNSVVSASVSSWTLNRWFAFSKLLIFWSRTAFFSANAPFSSINFLFNVSRSLLSLVNLVIRAS